jgi:hypothetical protein
MPGAGSAATSTGILPAISPNVTAPLLLIAAAF